MKYYTVYDNRTDEVVTFGSAKKCAEDLRMNVDSFYCLVSRGGSREYFVIADGDKEE